MELEKFEQKQVAAISKLQAKSNDLKKQSGLVAIKDNDSLKDANALVKEINAHKKLAKEERLRLTTPLNNVISQLIAKEKEVLLPLDEAKSDISDKILSYQEEQERIRKEEEDRIDEIITKIESYYARGLSIDEVESNGKALKEYYTTLSESDQANPAIKVSLMTQSGYLSERKEFLIEEERVEAERKRQAAEAARLAEEAKKQSEEEQRLAAERKAHEDEKRAIEEEKLKMQREKEELERQKEIQKAEAEQLKREKEAAKISKAAPKSNVVRNLVLEVSDEELVPREYCSPDMVKIRAAVKAAQATNKPFEIPGVIISTERKVR